LDIGTSKGFWFYSIIDIATEKFDISNYEVINFEDGLYATSSALNGDDISVAIASNKIEDWVEQSRNFELDYSRNRCFMSNVPLGEQSEDILHYSQQEIFISIKKKI
jgi:hypothetical protein